MALAPDLIDPVAFTSIRLVSGAGALLLLVGFISESRPEGEQQGSWWSAFALFTYALAFSLAYVTLDAGMGALILFGSVQATMIGVGMKAGERPHPVEWLGLLVAMAGLVYLVSPGLAAPNPTGAALMCVSGIAWGVYSLRGRSNKTPTWTTRGNFLRTVPMTLVAAGLALGRLHTTPRGVVIALVSGIVTSGLGYVLWYAALRGLTATRAAIVQLAVPVIAAIGGVVLLAEELTIRLWIGTVLILGGVATAILAHARQSTSSA